MLVVKNFKVLQNLYFFMAAFSLSVSSTGLAGELFPRESARFLLQSTLGFDRTMLAEVQSIGPEQWIDGQISRPANFLQPYLEALRKLQVGSNSGRVYQHQYNHKKPTSVVGKRNLSTAWMRAVLKGDDALRHKLAWSLSQILVVSNESSARTQAAANYYDLLLAGAFGSYHDLLSAVTYHAMTGHYLSYLGNQKADLKNNRYPDENYAREIMQLFTIGLWELNSDGSYRLNNQGERIPTYTIADVEAGARVFTGFKLARVKAETRWDRFLVPMRLDDSLHDRGQKSFFRGQLVLPAGNNARGDIDSFIRALVNHRNTAPFISRRLIQQMVTSNPTPEYIGRVVKRWRDTDGNLGQVVKAILLDPEARLNRFSSGKLRDPLSRVVQVIKYLGCYDTAALQPDAYPGLQWWRPAVKEKIGIEPLRADSVFNFFEPGYSRPGLMQEAGLVGPEYQILDEVTSVEFINYLWTGLTNGFHIGQKRNNAVNSVVCKLPRLRSQESIYEFLMEANLMLTAERLDRAALASIANRAAENATPKTLASLLVTMVASTAESAIVR